MIQSNLCIKYEKWSLYLLYSVVSFAGTEADGQIARPSLLICFAFDDKEGHRRIIPDNKSNPASFLPLESFCVQQQSASGGRETRWVSGDSTY